MVCARQIKKILFSANILSCVWFFCPFSISIYAASDKLPRGDDGLSPPPSQEVPIPSEANQEGNSKKPASSAPNANVQDKPMQGKSSLKVNVIPNTTNDGKNVSACGEGLLNYPGRMMYFSSDNKNSYHLVQKTQVTMGAYSLKYKVAQKYSEIYRYNYQKNKLLALKKAIIPSADVIFAKGENPQNFVLLGFVDQDSICASGETHIFQVKILNPINSFHVMSGRYSLVQSENNDYLLYDLLVNQAVDLDPKYFQLRKLSVPFAKGIRPLFMPLDKSQSIVGVQTGADPKYFQVLRFRPESKKQTILNIAQPERLIQEHGLVGSALIDEKNNTLILREIKGWSGDKSRLKTFKISLPADFVVSSATVRADFTNRRLIILGMSALFRQSWRKAFFVDYNSENIKIVPLEPGPGHYLSEVEFHPDGNLVVSHVQGLKDGSPIGLLFYEINTDKSYIINFKNAHDIQDEMVIKKEPAIPEK